jgi:hypothetical protein
MALEIILKLDEVQDFRSLPSEKIHIQKRLEAQVIRLAVLERSHKRQCTLMVNWKEEDANTKYFHMKINACRRKTSFLE